MFNPIVCNRTGRSWAESILPLQIRLRLGSWQKGNKKGKPERSARLVVVLFFGVVGLGDAIAFIFRVKLQGKMFGNFWAFFRQLNLRDLLKLIKFGSTIFYFFR